MKNFNCQKYFNHSALIILIFLLVFIIVLLILSISVNNKLQDKYNSLLKIVTDLESKILNINITKADTTQNMMGFFNEKIENNHNNIMSDINELRSMTETIQNEHQILIKNVYKILTEQQTLKSYLFENRKRIVAIEETAIMIQSQRYLQSIGVIKDTLIVDAFNTIYSTTNYNGLFTLEIQKIFLIDTFKIVPKKIIINGTEHALDLDLNNVNVFINGSETLSQLGERILKLEKFYNENEIQIKTQLIDVLLNLLSQFEKMKASLDVKGNTTIDEKIHIIDNNYLNRIFISRTNSIFTNHVNLNNITSITIAIQIEIIIETLLTSQNNFNIVIDSFNITNSVDNYLSYNKESITNLLTIQKISVPVKSSLFVETPNDMYNSTLIEDVYLSSEFDDNNKKSTHHLLIKNFIPITQLDTPTTYLKMEFLFIIVL